MAVGRVRDHITDWDDTEDILTVLLRKHLLISSLVITYKAEIYYTKYVCTLGMLDTELRLFR